MKLSKVCFIAFLTLVSCQTNSNLKLPSLIGDNMLLQQKTNAKIWGKANPGHKIVVTSSWNSTGKAISGKDGKWSVSLKTPDAGGPYTISISSGDTAITIKNVLIGEVWLCSGQSNMEMPMAGWPPNDTIMHSASAIRSSSNTEIRLFNVQKRLSEQPLDECMGRWEVCNPQTVNQFSATAYFFGRKLQQELKIPVGLIESSWGGTPSESWTSAEYLDKSGEFVSEIKAIRESAPMLAEYKQWLNTLSKADIKPAGDDQWKNLDFNDNKIPSTDFDDSKWPVITLPAQFEKYTGDFDGAVWFRRTIEVPQNMVGKEAILELGPIDDMDRTYLNGKLVGSNELSGLWQTDRNYEIPSGDLKSGTNVIAVRVLDTQGGGGISGAAEKMKLVLKTDEKTMIRLNGEWKYQPVAELRDGKFYIYDISRSDYSAKKRPYNISSGTPSVLFNGMICPVLPYQIKGAIWYQGESNVGRADQYSKIFPLMIQNWREAWGIKDFPFYFVQIAPYVYGGLDSTESALLREAQEKTLKLKGTDMVVTLDIATVMNIHPPYKQEVGDRLALLALNNNYGRKYPTRGPVYKSMTVSENSLKLEFDNADDGLMAKNDKLSEFEIAGKDGKYIKGVARIVNNSVIVSSPLIREPVSVRYCWRNGAEASLFNKSGLAAWQFRTK